MSLKHIFLLLLLAPCLIFGQKNDWKVDSVRGPHKVVKFTTDEGTWMNLDVSPDGKQIAFDLMGDIYIMPISGGKAKALRTGLPYEVQPRFSPDGKEIAFTSDAGGGDNIWIMDTKGENARQVTKESFRLLNNPAWTPDGQYIVARKHFTSRRSLGAGEMWIYHTSGGAGVQLTKKKNDQQDAGEPWVSPDGRYVYYSEDMAPGGYFKYNKDPNGVIYVVRRYDRETGKTENVLRAPGGSCRPQISRDGKYLAFVRRVRLKSVLFIHDLHTGEEWPVYDQLNKDQQETWAIFGVYPNFQWMPDGKEIVIWAKGKIQRVNIETTDSKTIPFSCDVNQVVMDAVQCEVEVAPKTFEAKMIRHTTTSPDGKIIVFHAAGHLYIKELPKGKPVRLTDNNEFEYAPTFRADGQALLYTTWNDAEMGAVKMRDLREGTTKTLTTEMGFYHEPRWSPDGKQILWRRGGGNAVLGTGYSKRQGLYLYDFGADSARLVHSDAESASFTPDGKRIWFVGYEKGKPAFKSCDLNGENEQTFFTSQYANVFVPSPDGKWLAFRELFKAYVVAIPPMGQNMNLSANMSSVPVFKVSRDVGDYLHWSGTGKDQSLHWMVGPEYYSRSLSDCFTFIEDKDSLPPIDTTGVKVGLTLDYDMPQGMVALTNARIITMKGDQVIEKGTILVEDNKIKKIGANVKVPGKAKIIDCAGKTIIPGIVDVHAHLGTSWNGISPQQQWSYYASLAYGTTTSHDPSANSEMVFSQSEMIKAGIMTGPRSYSTGTILYGADGDFKAVVNSLDDARSHLRRMKAIGAFSVKSYNQPRRDQRQQVIQAARELEMRVYPEGGSFFFHNMNQILDGHTGIEHSIPVSPVYKDVYTTWGQSQTGYTPTLIVGYGGIWGENYWYQKTNVWEKDRLLTFYPRGLIDSRSRRRPVMAPDDDFGHIQNAEGAKKIMDAGGKVQLGAHGQLHGLGAHWELWMFVQGGMSELEALRAATLWGAEYIGMDKEIGSLEEGKLADLVVLDKNPLENIQHTEFVKYTMVNGRLYDAATMNQIGNYELGREKFYWERHKGSTNFPWHEETHSCMEHTCSCHP